MAANSGILIIGMGAVGTMAAYALQASQRANITAVLRSNYDTVMESGFTIDSIDHGRITNWQPYHILNSIPDIHDKTQQNYLRQRRYDFIVLATKNTPDVGLSLPEQITPAVTIGHTCIVLMQNGLNIEIPFQQHFPQNEILSSVQLIGTEEISPGQIHHTEPDISYVGSFSASDSKNAATFISLYNANGKTRCHLDPCVRNTRWRKLIYNASYNSIAAITGLDVTRMRIHEHVIDDLVKPIMREIMAIAAAEGNTLAEPPQTDEELIHHYVTIDKLSSWFMPSMGQDAAKNNYLEYENIVGEPLKIARQLGVNCPTLTVAYAILKGMQERVREKRGLIAVEIDMAGRYK